MPILIVSLIHIIRWLKVWGADIASEGKQRDLMRRQLSDVEVKSESVPFSFDLKQGGHELRPAPIAYVTDLKALAFHLLDENDRLLIH